MEKVLLHKNGNKEVTLIGYGAQGQAWAQNLRDRGYFVKVFLRPSSPSLNKVRKDKFEIVTSLKESCLILLLIPDQAHKDFFEDNSDQINNEAVIIYAHGASLVEHQWQLKYPEYFHILLAPKAIASELRWQFKNEGKIGAVYSVEFVIKKTKQIEEAILQIAKDLGITAGPYKVTFEQETQADLFSEQSLLCGLLPYAAKKCFDFLIKKGIPEELAYLEAWHEVKLIGNAMDKLGPLDFFKLISPHAFTGAVKAKSMLLNESFDQAHKNLFSDIVTGKFFEEGNSKETETQLENELDYWKKSLIQKTYNEIKPKLT